MREVRTTCRRRVVSAQDVEPDVVYWSRRQALRPLRLFGSTLLGFAFVVFMGWLTHVMDEPTQFDVDLLAATDVGRPRPWSQPYAMDRAVLDTIDFEKVHAQLLPEWVIALQHDPYTLGRDREQRRFDALVGEAGKDPNLGALLERLRDRASFGVSAHAAEISFLMDGWNEYMQDAGLPWYVAHDLADTARGGRLFTRSYRVQADLTARVSGNPHHLRVLRRVDSTNVGEMFFGQTSLDERRALVVSDRIAEFAMDRLWPMMDSHSDQHLSSMDRAFAPALRREAASVLSADAIEALSQGAALRRRLQDRLSDIATRKGCGRGIEVENLPWDGLTPRGRSIVERAVEHNEKNGCTRLTTADADFVLGASDALSSDVALRSALGELSSWLARAVSVHEVRHLADELQSSKAFACDGCPLGMTKRGKAEVSAYVASLATEGVGYLSLYQACGVDLPTFHDSGGAVDFVTRVLAPEGCESAPPEKLYASAQLLGWVLFKRSEKIALPSDFPVALPLPSVRTTMPSPGFEALAEGPLQIRHARQPSFPMRSL